MQQPCATNTEGAPFEWHCVTWGRWLIISEPIIQKRQDYDVNRAPFT